MELQRLLDKADVVRRRPSRVVDVLREPRPIVRGGVAVNRLGLQVARALKDHAAWMLRNVEVPPAARAYIDEIEREGIVVIRDFLAPAELDAVRAEFERSRSGAALSRYKRIQFGDNFCAESLYASDWRDDFPATLRNFERNPVLDGISSAVCRRPMTYAPNVELFHVFKPDPAAPHTDVDYNQFVHADRHYPFTKAFFYLSDVTVDDAPYTYVRRSHQLSLARMRYEYFSSVQSAIARQGDYARTEEQLARDREVQKLSAAFLEEIRRVEEPLVAPGNTLIISNNQGFHRRGEMRGSRARTTINMDYKYLESHVTQWLYPVFKHLYR